MTNIQKYSSLQDIIALAEFAHRNQVDKAGMKYIEHPLRVMRSVQHQGALPYVQMAAVLHDVIEDTAFTADMLLELGVPEAAVNIVVLLTKVPGKSNVDYYKEIRKDQWATLVKLSDIDDNTQNWRLSYLSEETQKRLKRKYEIARAYLNGHDELAESYADESTGWVKRTS